MLAPCGHPFSILFHICLRSMLADPFNCMFIDLWSNMAPILLGRGSLCSRMRAQQIFQNTSATQRQCFTNGWYLCGVILMVLLWFWFQFKLFAAASVNSFYERTCLEHSQHMSDTRRQTCQKHAQRISNTFLNRTQIKHTSCQNYSSIYPNHI